MINIGIDWSETHHDICFMNDAGAVVTRVTVPHSRDGFLKLETTRQQLGVTANECRVGLETAHNLLIRSASCGPRAIARSTSFRRAS
jgi:Transposase